MQKKLILASGSPRRRELLSEAGFTFEVMAADADETVTSKNPEAVVKELSGKKAEAVYKKLKTEGKSGDIVVLGADTIVAGEDMILGKPVNREDAARMIWNLQGKSHFVYTGVSLFWEDQEGNLQTSTFADKTEVVFYSMTEEEILGYTASGECDDKAGSYAIQGLAMKFIEKIHGDYHNVVGLPVARVYQELRKLQLVVS